MLIRTPIDGSEPCERLVFDHDVPPITRATTTLAVPVLALTGATSYWASVVASPPGHMSGSGARGTGDLWQLPASWPARPIYDANRPSGVSAVQGDLWIGHRCCCGRMVRSGKVRSRSR